VLFRYQVSGVRKKTKKLQAVEDPV